MLRKLGDEYLIYHDFYVEKKDGKTAHIDHVVLSKYGIFVIETKNYKGWIFGNETQKNWMQVIYKKKTRFYNPIGSGAKISKQLQLTSKAWSY